MNYIEVKNGKNKPVKLAYCDYGNGNPVVLIHGWPLSKEMWEYQIEPLVNAGLRVVKYDRRGFGKSDKPWGDYDYDTLADDLKEVLDQLDLTNVTLVGFSMGGGEVAKYFSRHGGERVSKVILISSILPYMLKTSNNEGIPKEKVDEWIDQINDDRIAFLDTFGKQFFGINFVNHPVSTPLLEYYRMLASFASSRSTIECIKSFAFTDFREDTKSIDVPTLIIHGNSDRTVPIEISADKASKLIHDNQFVVYDGAPHGLFYTHKERLNEDIISFINNGMVQEHPEDNILFPVNEGVIFPGNSTI